MKRITVLLLISLVGAVLCGDDERKVELTDDTPYSDIPFVIRRHVDVIDDKMKIINDKKYHVIKQCWANVEMERHLLSLVVARNIDKTFKVLGETGEALEIKMPDNWYIPHLYLNLQKLMCLQHPRRMMDAWTQRALVPYN